MVESKEELVEEFTTLLKSKYGYSPTQLGFNVPVCEDTIADIAIWKTPEEKKKLNVPAVYILVNVKREHIDIEKEEYFPQYKSAAFQNVAFFVACNLKEKKVFYIDRNARPLKIEKISDFPKASDLEDERKLLKFINAYKTYSREEFLKILNKCHNIIRNIEKLSPEAAFDEISKVLFIKIESEKNKKYLTFTHNLFVEEEASFKGQGSYLSSLFSTVKQKYHADQLFESDEPIRLRRETFLRVLEEFEKIDLANSSEDIKGIAFESFLGKMFRGELGQFFTPRTIVNFMVDVLDVREGEKVCDPCCGSGGFLIKAFDKVQKQIDQEIQNSIQKILKNEKNDRNTTNREISRLLSECDKDIEGSRYFRLCHNYFFGVDANSRMARTSKMNMIMHGDGHVGVYLHDGLINVGRVYENSFDKVLINPPFGARVERDTKIVLEDVPSKKEKELYVQMFGKEYLEKVYVPLQNYAENINQKGEKGTSLLDLYELQANTTEILFIERCLNLLKPGGRAGIILPEGILDTGVHQRVRDFVEKKAKILNITSIPQEVFLASGANIKPSILFIEKLKENEELKDYELSITMIKDAGINSSGLPSGNNQLEPAVKEILEFLEGKHSAHWNFTKIIKKSSMKNWSVKQHFLRDSIHFNPQYKTVEIRELLSLSRNLIQIEPNRKYKRVKVRLFNKGLSQRDELLGREIGTKRQTQVKTGQFVISKIDGKSAAFGIVGNELNNAIVTPDFLVYDIDEEKIFPPFLLLILQNEKILNGFSKLSSGTTGRRRLSKEVFEGTKIALPTLKEQKEMMRQILQTEKHIKLLETSLENEKKELLNKVFTENEVN